MPNPLFNTARRGADSTLTQKPPLVLNGVTLRIFPLKANPVQLSQFCDAYLNVAPPEIAYFRPAAPIVLLMVLDYGKMAEKATNLGWLGQHEVGFTVPLELCRKEDGRLVFQDWAWVTPFIFVNHWLSLTTGRQVYGWAKHLGWLDPGVDQWLTDPLAPTRLMSLSTMVFPQVYEGERQAPRKLVEIVHGPPLALTVPPVIDDPANPLLSVPRAILGLSSWAWESAGLLGGMLRDLATSDPRSSLNKLRRVLADQNLLSPDLHYNVITLKQFRDAQNPREACYQALINSRMKVVAYNNGGPLGGLSVLRADASCGFRIRISRFAAMPIIETLGLEVSAEDQFEGGSTAELRPLWPYWLDLDMVYGVGQPLCWRAKGSPWTAGGPGGPERPPPAPGRRSASCDTAYYDTALGAAGQEMTGPFSIPYATLRILPLAADGDRLREFCESYLENDFYRFTPHGRFVYLVTAIYRHMSSATEETGWWSQCELRFSFPVKCDALGSKLALVSPFVFMDNATAAITCQEVFGWPTMTCSMQETGDAWLDPAKSDTSFDLLTMTTAVYPDLDLNQKMEDRVLVEIHRQLPAPAAGEEPEDQADQPLGGEELLGLLARAITLKQFRDCEDPNDACYQAIVAIETDFETHEAPEPFAENLEVRIHDYPSQPVVELLGLASTRTAQSPRGRSVQVIRAIKPVRMTAAMKIDLGKDLCWRSGSRHWQRPPAGDPGSTGQQ